MGNKFLEELVIGKTDINLPRTRKEQFRKVLRDNFFTLIKYSLFITLFVLPYIVNQIVYSYTITALSDMKEIFVYLYRKCFADIFLILIISVPVSGISYIIRKRVWSDQLNNEGILDGIKKQLRRFILIFLIIGVSVFIFNTGSYYYLYLYQGYDIVGNVLLSVSLVQLVFVLIVSFYMITMDTRYNLKIRDLLMNSIKLGVKYLFRNILVLLTIMMPLIVVYFVSAPYQIVIFIIIAPIYYSMALLLVFEYTAYIYDETVNKDKYPEIYKKGLDTKSL